jgi:cytochrome b6-f complex subunit 5
LNNFSTPFQIKKSIIIIMVEPLLSGIVLGLVPVTIAGLFVTAYLQYRRGDQATW